MTKKLSKMGKRKARPTTTSRLKETKPGIIVQSSSYIPREARRINSSGANPVFSAAINN